jgi:hypothetical protein
MPLPNSSKDVGSGTGAQFTQKGLGTGGGVGLASQLTQNRPGTGGGVGVGLASQFTQKRPGTGGVDVIVGGGLS